MNNFWEFWATKVRGMNPEELRKKARENGWRFPPKVQDEKTDRLSMQNAAERVKAARERLKKQRAGLN